MKKSKQLFLSIFLGCCMVTGNAQDLKLSLAKSDNLTWNKPEPVTDFVKMVTERNSSEMVKIMPTATCFCKVAYVDLTNNEHATAVCLDLTGTVNKTYSGLNPANETNRNDCNSRCTNATAALSTAQVQAIADCACAAGVPGGREIRSYSAVGTKDYRTSHFLGRLVNSPLVTQITCKCPATWMSSTTNQLGGVTTDGKCKKLVCQPISISPLPPDGTAIGTWGFTWGNASYAWGTQANGGAAICNTVVISPKICKIQP